MGLDLIHTKIERHGTTLPSQHLSICVLRYGRYHPGL